MKDSVLRTMSFDFALDIIRLCGILQSKKEFILSRQLLKAGTAIGALIREAANAESRADFIHKLGISQKEASETIYWLELIDSTSLSDKTQIYSLLDTSRRLYRMISSSILTAKQNLSKPKS